MRVKGRVRPKSRHKRNPGYKGYSVGHEKGQRRTRRRRVTWRVEVRGRIRTPWSGSVHRGLPLRDTLPLLPGIIV